MNEYSNLINIAPLCNVIYSSKTGFSTSKDDDYLLRRDVKTGKFNDFSFHSAFESNPFIVVNFPFSSLVYKLVITNRIICAEKADSLIVEGFNQSKKSFELKNEEVNFKRLEFSFDVPKEITNIKLSLREKNHFHLKFVEVFTSLDILEIFNCHYLKSVVHRINEILDKNFCCCISSNHSISFYNTKIQDAALYKLNISDYHLSFVIELKLNIDNKLVNVSNYLIDIARSENIEVTFKNSIVEFKLFDVNESNYNDVNFMKFHKNIYCSINMLFFCLKNLNTVDDYDLLSDKYVVVDTDSCSGWGFADRIRGALYLLSALKELNCKFFIKFTKPFNLNKYYHFNDFSMLSSDKNVKTVSFKPVNCAMPYTNVISTKEVFKNLINCINADCVYLGTNIFDYPSMSVYSDFFTRTNYLSDIILKYKKIIGFSYISVSFRFAGRLGDFFENGIEPLSSQNQLSLMNKCKNELKLFIDKIADPKSKSVLVLSDSSKFLNFIHDLPFVFVFPDFIQHISTVNSDLSENGFLKTLVDFNLIIDADESYLFISDNMYNSGFPKVACLCAGRTCKIHKF